MFHYRSSGKETEAESSARDVSYFDSRLVSLFIAFAQRPFTSKAFSPRHSYVYACFFHQKMGEISVH